MTGLAPLYWMLIVFVIGAASGFWGRDRFYIKMHREREKRKERERREGMNGLNSGKKRK
jgi:hypothetical protein